MTPAHEDEEEAEVIPAKKARKVRESTLSKHFRSKLIPYTGSHKESGQGGSYRRGGEEAG